jgi:hypothetical protein
MTISTFIYLKEEKTLEPKTTNYSYYKIDVGDLKKAVQLYVDCIGFHLLYQKENIAIVESSIGTILILYSNHTYY